MNSSEREAIIEQIFSYNARGIKYDLDRMRAAANRIGNPQRSFKSIHVAGTNGKGSICAYLDSILRGAGYRTGLYTSPHILDFEERFVVDGRMVSPDDWMGIFPIIEPLIADLQLTFFEISTLICFELFRRAGVEWAVMETGMGGRLDATNILDSELAVIASIDIDHAEHLGSDLVTIAGEKLGIVKQAKPLVMIRPASEEVAVRARDVSLAAGATFNLIDYSKAERGETQNGFESFWYKGSRITLPLAGKPQVLNALCALTACEILGIGDDAICRNGIETARLPGRFQVELIHGKQVVFDVAHNPGAAALLSATLKGRFPGSPILFVFGVMQDKDIPGILGNLAGSVVDFIFCQPETGRACPAQRLPALLPHSAKTSGRIVPGVAEAFDTAMATDFPVICVTGSFYTVGEAMKHLGMSVRT